MKLNKILKIVLNIAIVIAAFIFIVEASVLKQSGEYANKDMAEEYAGEMGVFEYKLRHKAYGEILKSYFTDRMYSMEAPEELSATYLVASYANTAFLNRIYQEKADKKNMAACDIKMEDIRSELGEYAYTADEIDEIVFE